METPPWYHVKRYTLIAVCTISIIVSIVYAAMVDKLVDEAIKQAHVHPTDSELTAIRVILIVSFVIAILFQLFGLVGAWREHFCLTCTYAVLEILGTINLLVRSFSNPPMWGAAVINILICIVVIAFLVDLRTIRNQRMAGGVHY